MQSHWVCPGTGSMPSSKWPKKQTLWYLKEFYCLLMLYRRIFFPSFLLSLLCPLSHFTGLWITYMVLQYVLLLLIFNLWVCFFCFSFGSFTFFFVFILSYSSLFFVLFFFLFFKNGCLLVFSLESRKRYKFREVGRWAGSDIGQAQETVIGILSIKNYIL